MMLDNLTREQAIELVGLEAVEKVESLDCECTSRVTDGTEWDGYDEWVATVDLDSDKFRFLHAYYFQKKEDTTVTEAGEEIDLSSLDWIVDHYEVV